MEKELSTSKKLKFLALNSEKFKVERLHNGAFSNQVFRLYVCSNQHGEYENVGSLSNIVNEAFKPFE